MLRLPKVLLLAGGFALLGGVLPASAQIQAGVVLDRDGLRHFHLLLGDYYGYPVQTVSRWHPSWVHADELPIVFLLAREARVSPEVVLALRERRWSWVDIALHLRVDPYIFVSHLPPYGQAYGYWRHPRSARDLRRLTDRQIIDYVNVSFWAGVHHRPVTEIIVIRERVPSWTHYIRVEAPRVVVQAPARGAPPAPRVSPQPTTVRPAPEPRPAQPRNSGSDARGAPRGAPATAPVYESRTPARVPEPISAPDRGRTPAAAPAPARVPSPQAAPAPARGPSPQAAPAPARAPAPAPAAGSAPPRPASPAAPRPGRGNGGGG